MEEPIAYLKSTEPVEYKDRFEKNFSFCITKACNMNCLFCIWDNFHRDNSFVDLDFFEECIIKMKNERYNSCSLVGGEVIIHPKFEEIIDILVKHKMEFTLVTNALVWERYKFLIENPKYNKYFHSLAVSLDGKKLTHDRYRGHGSYDKVIKALEYFTEHKKEIGIKMVLRKDNYLDIGHVFEISKKYGIKMQAFDCKVSKGFVLDQEAHSFLYKFLEDREKEAEEGNLEEKKFKILFFFDYFKGIQFCESLDDRELSIYPNGDVGFCCAGLTDNEAIGNIKRDSVQEILKNKCDVSLYLVNKIFPLVHAELPTVMVDSCALCRHYLGCKK